MSVGGREIPLGVLLWFGLLGSPLAWVAMFLVGYAFDLAQCNPAGTVWNLPVRAWTIAATAAGATVAVLSLLSALTVWRATREASDDELPGSRIQFLAVIGIAIAPLFLGIILMSGFGATFLESCRQS